jgi:hypothetical protein
MGWLCMYSMILHTPQFERHNSLLAVLDLKCSGEMKENYTDNMAFFYFCEANKK